MEYLPVELLAHLASYLDLSTRETFRLTCKILNNSVRQYHFVYNSTAVDKLKDIENQLFQRRSDQISIDFRNPPLKFRQQALTTILSISKYVNITSLNVIELTSELNSRWREKSGVTKLLELTKLTNLERLAINPYAINAGSFTNLTKLTVDRLIWSITKLNLSKLKNLLDLSIYDAQIYSNVTSEWEGLHKLTRLHIDANTNIAFDFVSILTNLKKLTLEHYDARDATIGSLNKLSQLEHLKIDVRLIPDGIALNKNLTRLEISAFDIDNLANIYSLTALKHLQLFKLKSSGASRGIDFAQLGLGKLPLRSAQFSISNRDNTQSIKYLNADLLLELSLEIDSDSKFKADLTRLINLEALTLTATTLQPVNLSNFARLTRLKLNHVHCGNNIGHLTNLKELCVRENQRELLGLNLLTNLEQLTCALKPTDVDLISSLTSLRYLYLTVKGLTRSAVISRLSNLTYLKVDITNFPPVSWLTSLTRLNGLDLINTAIKHVDFELLTALTRLTLLRVNCVESNCEVLFKMTRLQRVQLIPSKQLDFKFKEQAKKHLPHLISLKINANKGDDWDHQ